MTRVDAWLQRHFDRVIHALMRATGVSKRELRARGWMAMGAEELAYHWAHFTSWWNMAGMLAWMALNALSDEYEDLKAEGTTARSKIDKFGLLRKAMGLLMFAQAGNHLYWFGLDPRVMPINVSCVLFGLGWLYQGYLCGTDPQPPRKEEKARLGSILDLSTS